MIIFFFSYIFFCEIFDSVFLIQLTFLHLVFATEKCYNKSNKKIDKKRGSVMMIIRDIVAG